MVTLGENPLQKRSMDGLTGAERVAPPVAVEPGSYETAHSICEAWLTSRFDLAARLRAEETSAGCRAFPEPLCDSMVHTLLAPSKRARGVLTILAATALGAPAERAVSTAAAVEMLHAASLILDDLPAMDDATLRRGRAANHRVFGEDTAILAAVGLINVAYRDVNADASLEPAQKSRISLLLAEAVGPHGLTGGQFDDLRGAPGSADLENVESIHARKTARLFAAAAEAGAVIAGRSDAERPLAEYGEAMGLAFQAFDDMLDVRSAARLTGKDVGKDDGKATVIHLLGAEAASDRGEQHAQRAIDALAGLPCNLRESLQEFATRIVEGMRQKAAG